VSEVIKSESIAKLAAALSKAQGQIKGAAKDSKNPFFNAMYADLQSVWEACRKPLADNELSVVQMPVTAESGVGIVTVLMHSSGEYIQAGFDLKPKNTDPQGMGSAITYGRRYALAGFVGIYQTDDDAEDAADHGTGASNTKDLLVIEGVFKASKEAAPGRMWLTVGKDKLIASKPVLDVLKRKDAKYGDTVTISYKESKDSQDKTFKIAINCLEVKLGIPDATEIGFKNPPIDET